MSLPMDIIDEIFTLGDLGISDLLSLRATCKEFIPITLNWPIEKLPSSCCSIRCKQRDSDKKLKSVFNIFPRLQCLKVMAGSSTKPIRDLFRRIIPTNKDILVDLKKLDIRFGSDMLVNRMMKSKPNNRELKGHICMSFSKYLTSLTSLRIVNNVLIDDPTLADLTGLKELKLYRNHQHITFKYHASTLNSLSLKNCIHPENDCEYCVDWSDYCYYYNKTPSFQLINQLTSLTKLSLVRNHYIFDDDLKLLTNITRLNLGYNEKITKDGISHLRPSLTALKLRNNRMIRDDGLAHMTALTTLDLTDNNRITNDGIIGLSSTLTKLKLRKNHVISIDDLAKMTALTNLDISKCGDMHTMYDIISSPLANRLTRLKWKYRDDDNTIDLTRFTRLEKLNVKHHSLIMETVRDLNTGLVNGRRASRFFDGLICATNLKCVKLTPSKKQHSKKYKQFVSLLKMEYPNIIWK